MSKNRKEISCVGSRGRRGFAPVLDWNTCRIRKIGAVAPNKAPQIQKRVESEEESENSLIKV